MYSQDLTLTANKIQHILRVVNQNKVNFKIQNKIGTGQGKTYLGNRVNPNFQKNHKLAEKRRTNFLKYQIRKLSSHISFRSGTDLRRHSLPG